MYGHPGVENAKKIVLKFDVKNKREDIAAVSHVTYIVSIRDVSPFFGTVGPPKNGPPARRGRVNRTPSLLFPYPKPLAELERYVHQV